ncbi:hypothetical protein BDZ45DRAFT_721014 [Acephala macrosclerotiorum]|nr:hypothetical protein BDZ45DRAFT_721014 [Acephala macrosclerotiorum]
MADRISAAHTVFNTPELLALILSHLPFSSLLSTIVVSKHFRTTILTAPSLQRTLFLLPSLPSSPPPLNPFTTSITEVQLNPYFLSAFPSRFPENLEVGPKTSFPFMRESRSWRDMLILGGQVQIRKLRVREKVDVGSCWRSSDNWMGRPKIEGEVRGRVVGLALDIKPDRWEKVSWGAWFWCLLGSKMDWRQRTWGEGLWVLLGGGRKRLDGKAVRKNERLDEEFVLDVTIKPEGSRWEHWKFWSWWEQQMKVRKLKKIGFVREADRKPGECPHW